MWPWESLPLSKLSIVIGKRLCDFLPPRGDVMLDEMLSLKTSDTERCAPYQLSKYRLIHAWSGYCSLSMALLPIF